MNRDEFLSQNDLTTDTFEVPKWGTITIRELTGEQREELELQIQNVQKQKPGQRKHARAAAAALSIVGDDGKLLFTQADIPALATKSGVALDVVFDKVLTLNAMNKTATEELAKN